MTLGDIVDGHPGDAEATAADLRHIAAILDAGLQPASASDRWPPPVVAHAIGNHCIKETRRPALLRALRSPGCYHQAPLAPGWVRALY